MIPLKDYNPTQRFPVVTVVLMAANIFVFVFIQRSYDRGLEEARFTYEYAAVPCELADGRRLTLAEVRATLTDRSHECVRDERITALSPPFAPDKNVWLAALYSMFLHGSWLHLGGNMLYLWVFGNNIEDRMGPGPYIVFYLAAGLAATFAQVALDPSTTVPMIGASGAIAGVMGAYLIVFPNVRIHSLIFLGFFVFFREIGAKWLLGIWFVLQFFTAPGSGVAWMAHVGGFVFGVVVALLYKSFKSGGRRDQYAY